MKTTWYVIDSKTKKIVFTGPNGFYQEAKKYLDENKDKNPNLDLDPEMK